MMDNNAVTEQTGQMRKPTLPVPPPPFVRPAPAPRPMAPPLILVEGGAAQQSLPQVSRLRVARERLGLSVGDVCARLKMTPRQIYAMESGSTDGLPPAGYARAFVKGYARLLELDPDVVADELLGELDTEVADDFAVPLNIATPTQSFDDRGQGSPMSGLGMRMGGVALSDDLASATGDPGEGRLAAETYLRSYPRGFFGRWKKKILGILGVLVVVVGLMFLLPYEKWWSAIVDSSHSTLDEQDKAALASRPTTVRSAQDEAAVDDANRRAAMAGAEPLFPPDTSDGDGGVGPVAGMPGDEALPAFPVDASAIDQSYPPKIPYRNRPPKPKVDDPAPMASAKPPPYDPRRVQEDPSPDGTVTGRSATLSVPEGSPLKLTFFDRSWVTVRDRDGNVLVSQMNDAGTEKVIAGNGPFKVIVGNPKEVKLRHRGKVVDLQPYTREDVARLTLD